MRHRFPVCSPVTALALLLAAPAPARAFTQSGVATYFGDLIPMGHEWLTRRAAIELLLTSDPRVPPDPKDPRKTWTQGLAKNLNLSGAQSEVSRIKSVPDTEDRYASTYRAVFDTIIGERWVDIGGFDVAKSMLGKYNCFDGAAQEPAEVQYDHFMRMYNETGGPGGLSAAINSQQRFINYFIAAATAPPTKMMVWDGGVGSLQYSVDRNYFLLGRAAHLLQDSFSSEHTVRMPPDNYTTIKQVKSYICALGSEQHSHSTEAIRKYTSGDVIWIPGTQLDSGFKNYLPSLMKTNALVALEATKDLWAAFIRTMALPIEQRAVKARQEAQTIVANWLSFDEPTLLGWYADTAHRDPTYVLNAGDGPPGQTQTACMSLLKVGTTDQATYAAQLAQEQRVCLYNLQPIPGYADLYDPSHMHLPFNWQWISFTSWSEPPVSWQIPERPYDTGTRVQIKSTLLGNYMTSAVAKDSEVRIAAGSALDLIRVSTDDGTGAYYFRTAADPTLFLSYSALSGGTVKLWNGTTNSSYKLPAAGSYTGILNVYYDQYMWVDGQGAAHVSSAGDPAQPSAQWTLDQVPPCSFPVCE